MLIELQLHDGATKQNNVLKSSLLDHDEIIRIIPVTPDELVSNHIPFDRENPFKSVLALKGETSVLTTATPHQVAALIASARALTTRINHINPSTLAVCAHYSHVRLNNEGEAEWVLA